MKQNQHKANPSISDIFINNDIISGPVKGLEERIKNHISNSPNFVGDIDKVTIELYVSCPYEGLIHARVKPKKLP